MKKSSKLIFLISSLALAIPLSACGGKATKTRVERSPYELCFADGLIDPRDSTKLKSGFESDFRGNSLPADLKTENVDFITDVRTDEKSRIIRRFNKIDSGVIEFSFKLNYWQNPDGNVICIGNIVGNNLYYLEILNNYFFIRLPNGRSEGIYVFEPGQTNKAFFRIIVDFDMGNATTFINNTDCGTYPLLASSFDYISFESSISTINVTQICGLQAVANYRIYEDFSETFNDYIFSKFKINQGSSFVYKNNPLSNISYAELGGNSKVTRDFEKISTKVEFAFKAYLDGTSNVHFSLLGNSQKNRLNLTVDGNNILFDGDLVAKVYNKTWSDVIIVADLQAHTTEIKINNHLIQSNISIDTNLTSVDCLIMETLNNVSVNIDDIKINAVIDYETPLISLPPISDKYKIGITSTPYWENGSMSGWGPISSYREMEPVLGFYDEGSSRVVDWENKFLAEHGIDFQAFSWFYRTSNGPIKDGVYDRHINAYLNSQTTSFVSMAIMYEADKNFIPSQNEFINNLIPYWVEHFISQPSYYKIDGRPLFIIHNVDVLTPPSTSLDFDLAACLSALRTSVKQAGYANPIILAANNPGENLTYRQYGFDGTYAYNFGKKGFSVFYNEIYNEQNAASSDVYNIPTVSVGQNTLSYSSDRTPIMTEREFRGTLNYIKHDYFPIHPHSESWQEKFLMLSNWNDYGNGTYMMPTKSLGFKYLDIVRECFTDNDPHTDYLPTQEEKKEFTHTYPQNVHLIRNDGRYHIPNSTDARIADFSIDSTMTIDDFITYDKTKMSRVNLDHDGTVFKINSPGAVLTIKNNIFAEIAADDIRDISIVMSGIPSYEGVKLYYTTDTSPVESEKQSIEHFGASVSENTYNFDFRNRNDFKGKINSITIHPGETSGYEFHFKKLIINLKEGYRRVTINNIDVDFNMVPELLYNVFYLPFEPSESHIDRFLYVFYDWKEATSTLDLYRDGHKFSFEMGKDFATVDDNKRVELNSRCVLANGVPYLPLKSLITLFDNYNYDFSVDFDFGYKSASIITPEKRFFPV